MKKLISMIVAICLLSQCLMISIVSANTFTDFDETHWAYEAVSEMVAKGVINGYEDNTFKPSNNVTRAEFAKMLSAIMPESRKKAGDSLFADVPADSWYSDYVKNIQTYVDNNKGDFRPNEPLTREEAAYAIINTLNYDKKVVDYVTIGSKIKDFDSTLEKFRKNVALSYQYGILKGYENSTIKPNGNITRAEVASLLYRVFVKEALNVYDEKYFDCNTSYCLDEYCKVTASSNVVADEKGFLYFSANNAQSVVRINPETKELENYFNLLNLEMSVKNDSDEVKITRIMNAKYFATADKSAVYVAGYGNKNTKITYLVQVYPEIKVICTGFETLEKATYLGIYNGLFTYGKTIAFKVIDNKLYKLNAKYEPTMQMPNGSYKARDYNVEYYAIDLKTGEYTPGYIPGKKNGNVVKTTKQLDKLTDNKETVLSAASNQAVLRDADGAGYHVFETNNLRCMYYISKTGDVKRLIKLEDITNYSGADIIPANKFGQATFDYLSNGDLYYYDTVNKKIMIIKKIKK